jgi:hypothetical protein
MRNSEIQLTKEEKRKKNTVTLINKNGPIIWIPKIDGFKFTFWSHSVCVFANTKMRLTLGLTSPRLHEPPLVEVPTFWHYLDLVKPILFSKDEKVDMLLICGECRKNLAAVRRLYTKRYPQDGIPAGSMFHFWPMMNQIPPPRPEKNGQEMQLVMNPLKINPRNQFDLFKYQLRQHLYEDCWILLDYCD